MSHSAGFYTWQTNFNLSGMNPLTAQIQGKFASDNIGRVFLNGVDQGVSNPGSEFIAYTTFNLTSGFNAGVNILSFVVENANVNVSPNPTGLRVEVSGTALTASAPEPGALSILILGGALTLTFRRKADGKR